MPKVFYVLSKHLGGRERNKTISVFRTRALADDFAVMNYREDIDVAYVPEEVAEVWIVSAHKPFGVAGCKVCNTLFNPIVVATEAAAKLVRKPNECCEYSLCTTRCRIQGDREKPKYDTAYVVLTTNKFGLEDDGSVTMFRSLYAAERHQGRNLFEYKIVEVGLDDDETETYVVTSEHNGYDDCAYCHGTWFEASAFPKAEKALAYGNSRKCEDEHGCGLVFSVNKSVLKDR